MADGGPHGAAPATPGAADRRFGLALGALLLAPFVALVAWALTNRMWAVGDIGLTEVAVRDVGGAHTPLLGAYSRYHWRHPGPLLSYALAGPYRLLGSDGGALHAGAVVVGAVVVGVSAWLLWRRGRVGGLLVGAVTIAVLLVALGDDFLVSPWNPNLAVLPLFVFLLAVWSVACDDRWMLVVAVAAGSFAVQTHVGTAGVVGVGVAVAFVVAVVHARRTRSWRPLGVSVAVGVVLWIPPLVDALRHRGGNLRALFDFWSASHDHVTGWGRAGRIVASQFAWNPPWITGHQRLDPFTQGVDAGWQLPVVALALVGAMVVAHRRRDTATVRLGWLTVGLTVVAWASVARIVDQPYDYLIRWTYFVGAFAWLTIGWAVLGVLRARASASARRGVAAVAGAATAVMVVSLVLNASDARPASAGDQRLIGAVAPALLRAAPRWKGPVLVESAHDLFSGGLAGSVLGALVDAGVDARYPESDGWAIGSSHVVAPARAGTRLLVAVGDSTTTARAHPGYRIVISYDRLMPAERRELDRFHGEVSGIGDRAAWARRHPERARRLDALERRGLRAVVLVRD